MLRNALEYSNMIFIFNIYHFISLFMFTHFLKIIFMTLSS